MSLLTGITGGMGSGKTLVSSIFFEFGAYILDADAICRKLVEPGQPALKEISGYFGKNIIDEFGNLDRKKLAQIIFFDPKKKHVLEKILHPRVFEVENLEYNNICRKHPKALVIIDAALLIESGNYKKMDKVIVVDADKKTQIERVLARSDLDHNEVVARIDSQMSIEEKIKYADFVLDNSLDKNSLRKKVKDLHIKLSILAAENNCKKIN